MAQHIPSPCLLALFGASGDLTHRLLAPALYNLAFAGRLPEPFAVAGFARKKISPEGFRACIARSIRENRRDSGDLDEEILKKIVRCFHYCSCDFTTESSYPGILEFIKETARSQGTGKSILFYLATPPSLFAEVSLLLSRYGLLHEKSDAAYRRVIFEKPFGQDLPSVRLLNRQLTELLREPQIYRIDHYLGKETVQNILALRFANGIFEPIWNRRYVDSVRINVAETLGIGRRASYYEAAGALRDMVPNHLFQLLALIGMEPPNSFAAGDLRDEKVKCLRAVTPFTPERLLRDVLRGQYESYREEPGVARDSRTETFVALRLGIDNWRWAGVPFYLRTGKRLNARRTEVAVRFKCAPLHLFKGTAANCTFPNELVFGIQPDEGISLSFSAKVPGPEIALQDVSMDFDYAAAFGRTPQTGYETLLFDAMIGDATLFQRNDQIEVSWAIVDPIIEAWRSGEHASPLMLYEAGTQGPEAAPTDQPKPEEAAA